MLIREGAEHDPTSSNLSRSTNLLRLRLNNQRKLLIRRSWKPNARETVRFPAWSRGGLYFFFSGGMNPICLFGGAGGGSSSLRKILRTSCSSASCFPTRRSIAIEVGQVTVEHHPMAAEHYNLPLDEFDGNDPFPAYS